MNPGKPQDPKPALGTIIRWRQCPDCKGRGWFLIEPFLTGGANGAGGPGNICQCQTCESAKSHWDKHGCLPKPEKEAK